jgi:Fe-S cluster assembly protein SufD
MLSLTTKPASLIEPFDSVRSLLASYGPRELMERREQALREFSEFGVPTTKDEEFKYISLKVLDEGLFKPAYGATVEREELLGTPVGKIDAVTVAFVNGQYSPELSSVDALPEGVFVGSFQDAFEAHPDVVMRWLTNVATMRGRLGSTNDERFVALNTAYLTEGAFVYVPKGVALERTVHVVYLTKADHGPLVSYPRTLVVLEEAAQAKVLESYVGLQGVAFTNAVTEVSIAENSILDHTRFQMDVPDGVHIGTVAIHQEKGSNYTNTNGQFGSKIARTDVNAWVDGEHTETWLNGAYFGMGNQVIDNHTRIDHAQPNCHSFEVYKGILGGRASGVFNGKIFVYEDAQKTDAKQTNQAILLSNEASINTKPQLEIFADDVKCTHGATVGQLREEALFYLRSRGISLKQAQAILVYAFAAEVLDKISVEDVRDALEKVLFDKLNETEELPEK